MKRILLGTLLGFGLAQAKDSKGLVVTPTAAETRTHTKGKATVTLLAGPEQNGAKEAFVAILSMPAGGSVPEHADATEEFAYLLEGSGEVTIDGKRHKVSTGDLIYMPAGATASFQGDEGSPVKVLQVFANPGPEKKYKTWVPQ